MLILYDVSSWFGGQLSWFMRFVTDWSVTLQRWSWFQTNVTRLVSYSGVRGFKPSLGDYVSYTYSGVHGFRPTLRDWSVTLTIQRCWCSWFQTNVTWLISYSGVHGYRPTLRDWLVTAVFMVSDQRTLRDWSVKAVFMASDQCFVIGQLQRCSWFQTKSISNSGHDQLGSSGFVLVDLGYAQCV